MVLNQSVKVIVLAFWNHSDKLHVIWNSRITINVRLKAPCSFGTIPTSCM